MKKFIALSLLIGSSVLFVPSIEAKTGSTNNAAAVNTAEPQINIRIGRQRNRRTRVVTRTRVIRRGDTTYRETVRTTYFANGRTQTQIIRRVRVR